MPKTHTFSFTAISRITLEHTPPAQTSTMKTSDLRLEVSGNLERERYIDGRGQFRKDAMKPITQALIHGLVTHMRHSAKAGWWKEGEHMQYITNELQRAFVNPTSDPIESFMD